MLITHVNYRKCVKGINNRQLKKAVRLTIKKPERIRSGFKITLYNTNRPSGASVYWQANAIVYSMLPLIPFWA